MDGVDLAERMVSLYRMKARTNKWPVRVVMHFLDCAVSNAWILYREAAKECGTPKKKPTGLYGVSPAHRGDVCEESFTARRGCSI